MKSHEESRLASSLLTSSGIEQPGQYDAATLYIASWPRHCLCIPALVRLLRQNKDAQGALPSANPKP